jgi:hypothetical protein
MLLWAEVYRKRPQEPACNRGLRQARTRAGAPLPQLAVGMCLSPGFCGGKEKEKGRNETPRNGCVMMFRYMAVVLGGRANVGCTGVGLNNDGLFARSISMRLYQALRFQQAMQVRISGERMKAFACTPYKQLGSGSIECPTGVGTAATLRASPARIGIGRKGRLEKAVS